MYYLEVYDPTKDTWTEQERHDILQILYGRIYEGYRIVNKDHIRITEGWVLV